MNIKENLVINKINLLTNINISLMIINFFALFNTNQLLFIINCLINIITLVLLYIINDLGINIAQLSENSDVENDNIKFLKYNTISDIFTNMIKIFTILTSLTTLLIYIFIKEF